MLAPKNFMEVGLASVRKLLSHCRLSRSERRHVMIRRCLAFHGHKLLDTGTSRICLGCKDKTEKGD